MSAPSSSPRYDIYYTPAAEHPLTVAASAWLGRDAFAPGSGAVAEGKADPTLTSEPRRYGFHATLKAPFRLRDGTSVEELERVLRKFVAAWPPCPIGPLKIDLLGGFMTRDISGRCRPQACFGLARPVFTFEPSHSEKRPDPKARRDVKVENLQRGTRRTQWEENARRTPQVSSRDQLFNRIAAT
ncbi:DUF1045 domain-containing protein [Mesorhizobium tianshanense]|uniref:DUF1045 domain-containing protein n=1 Tax=Mesorhizobium tianshanense TaxID=39844 RepID=UPI00119E7028